MFSVEIPVEIKDEGFDVEIELPESRLLSDVCHRGERLSPDSCFGDEYAWGNDFVLCFDVGCGKTKSFSSGFSLDHFSFDFKRSPEQCVRFFDFSFLEKTPDETAAHSVSLYNDGKNGADPEIAFRGQIAEKVNIAFTVSPKVKIFSDHDGLGLEFFQNDLLDEILSSEAGKLLIKGNDEDCLDIKFFDLFYPLVDRLDHLDPIFSKDFSRMRIERQDKGEKLMFFSLFLEALEYFLVTQVDPVEISDGHDRVMGSGEKIFESAKDFHGATA